MCVLLCVHDECTISALVAMGMDCDFDLYGFWFCSSLLDAGGVQPCQLQFVLSSLLRARSSPTYSVPGVTISTMAAVTWCGTSSLSTGIMYEHDVESMVKAGFKKKTADAENDATAGEKIEV